MLKIFWKSADPHLLVLPGFLRQRLLTAYSILINNIQAEFSAFRLKCLKLCYLIQNQCNFISVEKYNGVPEKLWHWKWSNWALTDKIKLKQKLNLNKYFGRYLDFSDKHFPSWSPFAWPLVLSLFYALYLQYCYQRSCHYSLNGF